MVLKKSIYYGRFDGFQAPLVPKAPRSSRRSSHTKSSEGSKLCAFELLAAVAGKLLQESESSTSGTGPEQKEQVTIPKEVRREQSEVEVKVKRVRSEHLDQGSCADIESIPEPTNLALKIEPLLKELPQSDNDSCLEHASSITTSDFLKKVGTNVKLEASEGKNVDTLGYGDLCSFNLVNHIAEKQGVDLTFRDPVESRVNTRVLYKSCSRDDNENSFRCNHRGSKMRAFRSQSGAGYRRIRKMLTSRYWKVASKNEDDLTNTNGGDKPFYQNRKNVYLRERCQTEAASKRRKLYIQEASSEKGSFQCKDSHVKFSIKSFKVPELYLEVPETTTVGSLKRTVMEAVTAILGDEIRVGILLEGKKVRDNNITLEQTGISQNCNPETLGFTLEPSFPHASPSGVQKEPPLLLAHDTKRKSSRSSNRIMDVGFSNSPLDPPRATSLENHVEKNHEITFSSLQTEVLAAGVADSQALVPVPAVKAEVLSMVPVSHKPTKKSELSHRRTRRPFSVSEVEALVEAVETLGTGRWRDVKLRAFDDANHRTYVDLKDKWKTLVHTASISPQQRRGEPVPQDLLDRVLAAHAHWSHHQFKLHRKHQNEPLQISNAKLVGI